MIYTVTLNPSLDKTLFFPRLVLAELNRARQVRLDVGGKGFNVSRALLALGVSSVAMGLVAGATGECLRRRLAHLGIEADLQEVEGTAASGAAETRSNLTVVDEATGQITKLNEPGPWVSDSDVELLLERIQGHCRSGDLWALSGSVPPGAPLDIYARIIQVVQQLGGRALLDSSGPFLTQGCHTAPFAVKPNVEEAGEVLGRELRTEADLCGAVDALWRMGIELVALSRGHEGAIVGRRGQVVSARPPPVAVTSPIGAGDAFLAGVIFALTLGLDLDGIARWAVAAGTAAAMHEGTGVGKEEEVRRLVRKIRTQDVCSNCCQR